MISNPPAPLAVPGRAAPKTDHEIALGPTSKAVYEDLRLGLGTWSDEGAGRAATRPTDAKLAAGHRRKMRDVLPDVRKRPLPDETLARWIALFQGGERS